MGGDEGVLCAGVSKTTSDGHLKSWRTFGIAYTKLPSGQLDDGVSAAEVVRKSVMLVLRTVRWMLMRTDGACGSPTESCTACASASPAVEVMGLFFVLNVSNECASQ